MIRNLDEVTKSLSDSQAPDWFNDRRAQGLSRFTELGIPTVVGVPGATQFIEDGQEIEIDGRQGLVWLAVGVPVALLAGWLSSADPVMRAVYPLDPTLQPRLASFIQHIAGQLVYYVAWELLFRGVLLFGLEKRLGFAGANIVQTALSTVAHFGRPLPETLAAIPS